LFISTSRLYKLLSSYCVIIFYGLTKATFTALKPLLFTTSATPDKITILNE
jgi:hypothetical protein